MSNAGGAGRRGPAGRSFAAGRCSAVRARALVGPAAESRAGARQAGRGKMLDVLGLFLYDFIGEGAGRRLPRVVLTRGRPGMEAGRENRGFPRAARFARGRTARGGE